MNHFSVYSQDGVYAGWPANHGAWQWGDEFLVGFIRGDYGRSAMHNVVGPLEKVQARSLDGGKTWALETPNVDFNCAWTVPAPAFSLEGHIIRCCGGYDHGGDDCDPIGGFYLSADRGRSWDGAYAFTGLGDTFAEPFGNTCRTAVLGDLVFLSRNHRNHFGTDSVIIARHNGTTFDLVGQCQDEKGRVVMPAPVRVGKFLVMACRRRGDWRRDCWIDAYASQDEGATWHKQGQVGDTGAHNGNPPALIESGGKLVCAFANRNDRAICISVSEDLGNTWTPRRPIRPDGLSDIGYPRILKREDGTLVCIYYWADAENKFQRIEATHFLP